jgi:signal transduction histidine kinase
MSLQRALLLLVATVLLAAVVPAGVLLDRRLGEALRERTRDDLARAPRVLEERMAGIRDARMMHAKELAGIPGLVEALRDARPERARTLVTEAARAFGEEPLLWVPDAGPGGEEGGVTLAGSLDVPPELTAATREGRMPVRVVPADTALHLVALAPVMDQGTWLGAAGGSTRIGEGDAGTLAGLTRSTVVIFRSDGRVVSTAGDSTAAGALARRLAALPPTDSVRSLGVAGETYLASTVPWDEGVTVAFARSLERELALLPDLRRTAFVSTGVALAVALLVGTLFAQRVARPVESLAGAADRFAGGDVDAPLPRSSLTEVSRVAQAFGSMRRSLALRLEELEAANRELEERQERLSLLQSELVQRERVAATGRILAQLAHEIRNPVASVRNCLEVVRRKGDLRGEALEFADMAVDELLRMHELAERMLDLHRPREPGHETSPVTPVARNVARLVRAGEGNGTGGPGVSVVSPDPELAAAIPPDELKQILLNLVLNAREVTPPGGAVEVVVDGTGGSVRIEVLDRGPGIPEEALPRIFDPFFSTKDEVHGVGLGLFTAEGLVRRHGGRIRAENRVDGPGARFVVELPEAG